MKCVALTIAVVVLAGCDFMGKRAEAEARTVVMELEARVSELERKLVEQRSELTELCEQRLQAVQVPACPGAGDSAALAKLLGQAQGEAGEPAQAQGEAGEPAQAQGEAGEPAAPQVGAPGKPAIACAKDRCTLPRTLLDGWAMDPSRLAKQARVVPSVVEGEVVGFKLYGIRATTEVAAVGLQNGDMVTALGGRTLRSMDGALAAMTAVRSEREWAIEGERQGAPFKITIVVE